MVATKSYIKKGSTEEKKENIPDYLIYEMLDGIPIYYKGFRDVINKTKTLEEIMAYGIFQWLLINVLKNYFEPIFGKKFWLLSGEGGLHIKQNSNPSLDFVFLLKSKVSIKKALNKYLDIPPSVVIEVDTKADIKELSFTGSEYVQKKTQELLNFGVSEVLWIFTQTEKVVVARPNAPWLTHDWKDTIKIMGHPFSVQQIIEDAEKEERTE